MVTASNQRLDFSVGIFGISTLCGNNLTEINDSRFLSHNMDFLEDKQYQAPRQTSIKKNIKIGDKNITLIDAFGHNQLISCMLAEVAVVVVPATQNGFDSEFVFDPTSDGSSRQYLKILSSSCAKMIIIAITKMDCDDVNWSEYVFNTRVKETTSTLQLYFSEQEIQQKIYFVPISDYGENIENRPNYHKYSWCKNGTLFDLLASFAPPIEPQTNHNTFIGMQQKYEKKNGISGLVHRGTIKIQDKMILYPQKLTVSVIKIEIDENQESLSQCQQGQWVTLYLDVSLDGTDCSQIVISNGQYPTCIKILVQITTFRFPPGKPTALYQDIFIHTRGAHYPCRIIKLIENNKTPVKTMQSSKSYTCILHFQQPIVIVKQSQDQLMSTFLLSHNDNIISKGNVLKYSRI